MRKIALLLLLLAGVALPAQSQDSTYMDPKGLYFEPVFSVDLVSSNTYNDADPFLSIFPQFSELRSFGLDIGYYKGSRNYGLQLKYGTAMDYYDLENDASLNGEQDYKHFFHIGAVTSGRILGTRTRAAFQARINYRTSLGYYQYSGQRFIKDDASPDGKVIDIVDKSFGLEFGLGIQLGFRPTDGSAVMLSWEPAAIQISSLNPGINISRLGLMVQL